MLSRWPSICPSVRLFIVYTYVRPLALPSRSIIKVFMNGFHSNFSYIFVLRMLHLKLLMGIFRQFITELKLLSSTKNGLGLHFLHYLEYHDETSQKWEKLQKLYNTIEIVLSVAICSCPGAIYMNKIMKQSIYGKSKFEVVLLETCSKWSEW